MILIDVFGDETAPHQQSGVGSCNNLLAWLGNPRLGFRTAAVARPLVPAIRRDRSVV